jgi:hypothetical protein
VVNYELCDSCDLMWTVCGEDDDDDDVGAGGDVGWRLLC